MKFIIKHIIILILLFTAEVAFGQWNCLRKACISKAQMENMDSTQLCDFSFGGIIDSASCNMMDGSIQLQISGSRSGAPIANWSTGQSGTILTNLSAGSYSVTVTDGDGCDQTGNYTIFSEICSNSCDYMLNANFVGDCQEGTLGIDLNVSGATGILTYLWSNGAITQDVDTLSVTDSPYSVTVTDEDGCETIGNFDVQESCECNPIQIYPDIKYGCEGTTTGVIRLDVTGGVAPYNYQWESALSIRPFSSTDKDLNNVRVGQGYNLTVTDSRGCQFSDEIYVPFLDGVSGGDWNVIIENISCFGGGDGYLEVVISDTVNAPYTFEWYQLDDELINLGVSTPYLNNLRTGIYNVIVRNKYGCENFGSYVLGSPDKLQSGITVTDAECGNLGEAIASVSGGTPGYNFLWSNGQSTQATVGLNQGWVYLTITDANNCQVFDSAYVDGPFSLECGDGAINVIEGTAPFTYQWNTGNPTDITATIPPGRNTVEVTDATGCIQFITCGDCPTPIGTPCDDGDDCTENDRIQNDCNCRGSAINETGQSCDDNDANTYNDRKICVDCVCDCEGTDCNININLSASPLCPTEKVAISSELSGTFYSPVQYSWTGPNGFTSNQKELLVDDLVGTYTLTLTDAVGCTATETISFEYSCIEEEFCQLNLSSAGGKNGFAQTFVAQADGIAAFLFNPYDLPDELTIKINGDIVHQNCWSNNGWTYPHCPADDSNGGLMPSEEYITWQAGDQIRIEVDPNCKTGTQECENGGFTKWELAINCVSFEGQFAVDVLVSCEDLDRHKPIKVFATGGTPPYTYEWLTGPSAGYKWTFDPTKPTSYLATGNSFRETAGCDCSDRTVRVTDADGLQIERTITETEMPCCNDGDWGKWEECNQNNNN